MNLLSHSRCLVIVLSFGMAAPVLADSERQRVSFQAEASEVMANDELRATFYVETQKDSAQALSAEINRVTQQALRLGKGATAVKLNSGNIQQWPIYDKKNNVSAWRGRAEVQLRSTDMEAASGLMAKLQTLMQLQGLSFSVSDTRQDTVETALTAQAIAAFKAKAELVQRAWGAKRYQLVQLHLSQVGGQHPMPRPMAMMSMKAAQDESAMPAPEFSGGESTLRVQASGTIELFD